MKKPQKSWTKYDIKYLTENYGILKTKQIAIDLSRTYQSVKSMATKRLKLKHPGLYKENLFPLLNDSNEIWYWLGFIAADGNINNQYLNVLTHIQDVNHLQLLANKLNVKISFFRKKYPKISISDTINISLLKK